MTPLAWVSGVTLDQVVGAALVIMSIATTLLILALIRYYR
jgi:hypothetical protein